MKTDSPRDVKSRVDSALRAEREWAKDQPTPPSDEAREAFIQKTLARYRAEEDLARSSPNTPEGRLKQDRSEVAQVVLETQKDTDAAKSKLQDPNPTVRTAANNLITMIGEYRSLAEKYGPSEGSATPKPIGERMRKLAYQIKLLKGSLESAQPAPQAGAPAQPQAPQQSQSGNKTNDPLPWLPSQEQVYDAVTGAPGRLLDAIPSQEEVYDSGAAALRKIRNFIQ